MDFKLINTEDTVSRLLNLLREARERVTLISPYVTLGADDRVGRSIREALARKVKVSLVYRQDDHTTPKEDWLAAMKPHVEAGLKLFAVPGLHAKLYLSESTVIITSLNLLASSFLNSIEVGLWSTDPEALKQAQAFIAKEIAPHAQPTSPSAQPSKPAPVERKARTRAPRKQQDGGYCLRCGDSVPLNPSRPYCREDFAEWAQWENVDYEDNYCHGCGEDHPATMARPLCRDCYRKSGS
ncbi:phospholipase D family protein [Corallococcus aberystwythensis]|uniref:Phospholipase D-like domain-containing protein n=1 Tax=Corallococcus aberystwythensis TaxID=2316722 RepID=A0A3A8PXK1_9BACT|nr:phospholipase D family protein [Corallococcus aberystwythensis]RKH61103.1 hypothetical protein D7W81_24485 [Corallococcus aberystwythensis]